MGIDRDLAERLVCDAGKYSEAGNSAIPTSDTEKAPKSGSEEKKSGDDDGGRPLSLF